MGVITRRRTRIVLGVLVVAAVAMLADSLHLWRLQRWNDAIAADPPLALDHPPAELQFALAHAQAASGAGEEALKRYRVLQGDTPLGQAARYNSANLLMRQAIAVRATPQPGLAIPLLELAKEGYREVLRNDPGQWDARYNLERAQRLLPDPDDSLVEPADGRRDAERAVTTMRGYSPGLP
ncbi:MxaK protein [Rhizobacter sp. SG703]|uniref:MxaK protein n=1 Tax=Rhizobacter sp. SG703 TaxID=2587140 RepID=UPI001445D6F1|nr:MxaK protein [Rhizobacter sp. SG703]NKI97819.1 mxaK protein [Rhizobacter sp. SG703]